MSSLVSSMLWVQIPPEELFVSFSMEKELLMLYDLVLIMYVGLTVSI